MAKKKDDTPEHIKKYKKLSKKANRMIATMERHHRNAYDAAVDEVLMEDGQVDIDKLDAMENRDKFADKMADHYLSKAKQVLKVKEGKEKLDDLEQELLMNAYTGTTKSQLKQYVREKGKKFTFDHFYTEVRPGIMKSINQNLRNATMSHFKNDHIGDIVKHTKTEEIFDKGKMQLGEALGILQEYELEGAVGEKTYKEALFYKKKDKKEKKAA